MNPLATKLKGLKIKRVALVDQGANPDADVLFAKSVEGLPDDHAEPPQTEDSETFIKRFVQGVAKLAKSFGISSEQLIEKDAATFDQVVTTERAQEIIDRDIYPMQWAFTASVRSILMDAAKTPAEKAELMKQSLSEYADAFGGNIAAWTEGRSAETQVEKNLVDLSAMRDDLTAIIEKAASSGEDAHDQPDQPDGEGAGDPNDNDDQGDAQAVKKGATPEMKFDVEHMTPEDKAQYEALSKKYGSEDKPADPTPAPAADPAPADDDLYKGLHPDVKAELEALRTFRQESELREMTTVAKKYELLGHKPEDLAAKLVNLRKSGGTAYNDMIAVLDSSLAAVEKSGAFAEIGKSATGSVSGPDQAWNKIEVAAAEIMKSKPGLHYAQAIDEACQLHPELVSEYEKRRG